MEEEEACSVLKEGRRESHPTHEEKNQSHKPCCFELFAGDNDMELSEMACIYILCCSSIEKVKYTMAKTSSRYARASR